MLTRDFARLSLLFLCATAATSPAHAQTRDRASTPAAAASDTRILADGWSALASGQGAAAVQHADQILSRRPWDHSAAALKIAALSSADPTRGLESYETWMGRGQDDAGLLDLVAREVMRAAASGSDPRLRREARQLMSAAHLSLPAPAEGDAADTFAHDAALAQAGDASALQRLEAMAGNPMVGDKTPLVKALEDVGTPGQAGLIEILKTGRGPAPGDAARALGRLNATGAVPALKQAMNTPEPYTRSSAAVALALLGDSAGEQAVSGMLDSQVPDIRLMAAEAWRGQDGPWVSAVMPLLDNQDGLIRLRAAGLIAPVNPDAARRVLDQASGDPNPVVRSEALAITARAALDHPTVADLPGLRKRLRDADPAVRMYAAAAIMAVARGGR